MLRRLEAEAERRPILIGLLAAGIVVCVWTGFILVSRAGSKGVLSAADLAALRFGVAGLVMAPIVLRRGLCGLHWWQALVIVATAGLGFPLFAYSAFQSAPAAHGAVLMPGVLPLWTALLGAFLLQEPLGHRRRLALLLIVGGVVLLAYDSLVMSAATSSLRGDLLFLCASFFWGCYTIMARRWRVRPIDAAAIASVGAALVFVVPYLAVLPRNIAAAGLAEIVFQGIYQGVLATIVALLAFTTAVHCLGARETTMITAMVPGLAALLAVPILGEPLSPWSLGGLVLTTSGMLGAVLALERRSRHPRSLHKGTA